MFNRELFRKKALEKLSTPDDLDELLQVNSRLSWLLLVSLLCVISGGFVWGFYGQIVNKIPMTGTIQPVSQPVPVVVTETGQVDSILHRPGDNVGKGQPLIRFYQDDRHLPKFILSPCNGELTELNTREGALLTPGSLIARIGKYQQEQTMNPEFLLFVSANQVDSLNIGQKVNIILPGHESESIRVNTWISYIAKLPASDESISSIIFDKTVASQLSRGNFYLVRTICARISEEADPLYGHSIDDLSGKVCHAEAIISQMSPISYLLSPSKR